MKKVNFSTAIKNIKSNFCLLFSTMAALCLYSSPSFPSAVITVVAFAAVAVAAAFDVLKPTETPVRSVKAVCILLAALILYKGYVRFNIAWSTFDKVAVVAWIIFRTSDDVLLRGVGALGCVGGFYAMYNISCRLILLSVAQVKERLPVQDKAEIKTNLKRNFYFPISAVAFFYLSAKASLGSVIGLLIAFLISLLISSQTSSIWEQSKKHSPLLRGLSFISAIGICLAGHAAFRDAWNVFSKMDFLELILPKTITVTDASGAFCAAIAVYFVYLYVLLLWGCLTRSFRMSGLFSDIRTSEWIIYGILLLSVLGLIIFSFTQTKAFYGTSIPYDIIYTSDSPSLVRGNVYLYLTHSENDLRQPLFAVFAAPFVGIPYLLARLVGATATVRAILVNSVQILMLFAANYMLAKMLRLNTLKRICFMTLSCCTYTLMLFALMMEQYIVAYFWLIICVYQIAEKQQPERLALWGAGGTLLTSMILLPFMSAKSFIKDFKAWFMDMVKYGIEFVVLMLAFCRFDVFYTMVQKSSTLIRYTGKNVTFTDKLHQYADFVSACLIAPDAGINTTAEDYISWQMNTATDINMIGIIIFLLVITSAIWNRDKKSSLLAAGWVGFSAVMLLGLGWGTHENGLILYALYFGWAFFILLFQLIEKIECELNINFLIPVFTVFAVIALLLINVTGIMEMVNFAITYYPV